MVIENRNLDSFKSCPFQKNSFWAVAGKCHASGVSLPLEFFQAVIYQLSGESVPVKIGFHRSTWPVYPLDQ